MMISRDQGKLVLLAFAKEMLKDRKNDKAIERLKLIVNEFPKTKAAIEARALLKELGT